MYRQRFGLTSHVFPQSACGRTFTPTPSFDKLARRFAMLAEEPGLGVVIGEAGVGKTSAMRHLCASLPQPSYRVTYICDTATSPLDFYRQLATDLGVQPSHRRSQLWTDLKTTITHLVDEQDTQPLVVVDEAQHLSERFLLDLAGFLNFAFDSRSLVVFWLVGQPVLAKRLGLQIHAALSSRIAARVKLEPLSDRGQFAAFLQAGLEVAGADANPVSEPAIELLFRTSKGMPRQAAHLLREAMIVAHEREQSFVDDTAVEAVLEAQDF
ncbi:MAG: ATP-binding protein [Planctomycetota bacterium]|nr:ATP-binding protein [Planctomycetota bacterium]